MGGGKKEKMMADMRNDLAKARDAWLESLEGVECAEGRSEGQFLRNRLERAFLAGWFSCEVKTKELAKEQTTFSSGMGACAGKAGE